MLSMNISRQARWRAVVMLLIGLGSLAGAGCSRDPAQYTATVAPLSTQERHPIVVESQPQSIEVAVHPAANGLTPIQQNEVSEFLHGYRVGASGHIVVQTPSGSSNESAALSVLSEIREIAAGVGIPESRLSYQPYGGHRAGAYPPIVMVYSGLRAVAHGCGVWPTDLGKNPGNQPYADFGCAMQRNTAAMVANPHDLVRPRAMDPASSERRSVVRDKYIKGEVTAADSNTDDEGTVSEVAR